MATINLIPTANQTPDATLGGDAVTTPTNTGHASSTSNAADGTSQTKSCRWFTFQTGGGQVLSITLKITHTSDGTRIGAGASNIFALEYTLNGGGSWLTAVQRNNFSSSEGPTTFSVALSATQDISQVQVRDNIFAQTVDVDEIASATVTISDIKLEVVTADSNVVVMM